jgi:hypothetical protein
MRRGISLFLSVGAAVAVVSLWSGAFSKKRLYDGKPIAYWIDHPQTRIVKASDSTAGYQLEFRFPVIDSNAVPALIKALTRSEGRLDSAYRHLYYKLPTASRRLLSTPRPINDEQVRLVAIMVLGRIGEGARPAIPGLIHVLKSDESDSVRLQAADLLTHFVKGDREVHDAFLEALNDKNVMVRLMAEDAIAQAAAKARGSSKMEKAE